MNFDLNAIRNAVGDAINDHVVLDAAVKLFALTGIEMNEENMVSVFNYTSTVAAQAGSYVMSAIIPDDEFKELAEEAISLMLDEELSNILSENS